MRCSPSRCSPTVFSQLLAGVHDDVVEEDLGGHRVGKDARGAFAVRQFFAPLESPVGGLVIAAGPHLAAGHDSAFVLHNLELIEYQLSGSHAKGIAVVRPGVACQDWISSR